MPAHTIDQVIAQLDEIVAGARSQGSRVGYFAALYRQVTIRVKEGIASGRFDDAARMERLDVQFANRYLQALEQFHHGEQPSASWLTAFQVVGRWRPLVLQHLLLAMNAHINVDLAIAAAQTCPGVQLPALERDFQEINTLLSEMLDVVQDQVSSISPLLGLLDYVGGRTDEAIAKFSIQKAREASWQAAERLAPLSPEEQAPEIARLDRRIAALGHRIRSPGKLFLVAGTLIRLFESNDVPRVIDALT